MAKYLLALDVGTSAAHCILTDLELRLVAASQAPMSYFTPPGAPSLAKELDPQALLDIVDELVSSIARQVSVAAPDLAAIGVTSQRQSVVFLDGQGKEVYCSPNLDMRAVFQGAAMDDALGPEIYRTTGHFPSFMLAAARLRWLRESHPKLLAGVSCVLPLASWLAYRLTGEVASEACIDAEAGLVDVHTRGRCAVVSEKWGLDPALLPTLLPAGTPLGGLNQRTASRWGLEAGTPVTIAGPDTQCALMGMGVVEEGQTGAVLGWSGALQSVTAKPCLDPDMRTWVGCHSADGLWVAEANLGDAGNAYGWLKDLLLGTGAPFERAEALAAAAPPGSEGALALLGPGSNTAPRAGLRTGGLLVPVPLAFHKASPGQLLRAALDGVAFSARANLATLQQVTRAATDVLYVGGGMSASTTLMQTLADVSGACVVRSGQPQPTAMGAAMAASVAASLHRSFQEAAARPQDGSQMYEPRTATAAEYEEHYQRWVEAASCLAGQA